MSHYGDTPKPEGCESLTPLEARAIFRRNSYHGPTVGFCLGFMQMNVVILPVSYADDFEVFCKSNPGPFPLLYRSKIGEHAAPVLATDSDIRFDIPGYKIFKDGECTDDVPDLRDYEKNCQNSVTFYFGCSYSFEKHLQSNGVELKHIQKELEPPMFITSIAMKPAGTFKGNLAVSMRPILKSQLQKTVQLASQLPLAHGAPIHIGCPARIGIRHISVPDWGDVIELEEGEVPVFWPCGVSAFMALKHAAPPLAFAQGSGSLFITDLPADPSPITCDVEVIELVQEPFFASVLESKSVELISKLEKVVLEDPGQRGVAHLFQESDLLKSVLALSHADRVAVTTGFPACEDKEVKEETDGLPGALSICQALLTLGKDVTLLCDSSTRQLYQSCIDHMKSLGALKSSVEVLTYSSTSELVKSSEGGAPPWDVLLAIERAGRNKEGKYCSMSGRTVEVEPMDDIFISLSSNPLVNTVCIGDGGNELGMGKVYDRVVEFIPNGSVIACQTACDYVVVAGVSNWAGLAISLGLYVVSQSPVHWRYRNHGVGIDHTPDLTLDQFMLTDEQVISLLKYMNKLGFSDGRTGKRDSSVDGLPLQKHLGKRKELINLIH